jgi:hypothetical protein
LRRAHQAQSGDRAHQEGCVGSHYYLLGCVFPVDSLRDNS